MSSPEAPSNSHNSEVTKSTARVEVSAQDKVVGALLNKDRDENEQILFNYAYNHGKAEWFTEREEALAQNNPELAEGAALHEQKHTIYAKAALWDAREHKEANLERYVAEARELAEADGKEIKTDEDN